jgi:hypothetical protein
MGTLLKKHKALRQEVASQIAFLIHNYGQESNHQNEKVLHIKDDQQFNLDGGRYLTEVSTTELIDNCGYTYHYDVLTLEQLCEIADSFLED